MACGWSRASSEPCEPLAVTEVRSSALAVVPYDEKTMVVPDFYQDERRLQFGDFTVTISQNWRDVGVAAVLLLLLLRRKVELRQVEDS